MHTSIDIHRNPYYIISRKRIDDSKQYKMQKRLSQIARKTKLS